MERPGPSWKAIGLYVLVTCVPYFLLTHYLVAHLGVWPSGLLMAAVYHAGWSYFRAFWE